MRTSVAAVLTVAALAVPAVAAAQQTAPNPTLAPSCGLRVIVVLDASGSIASSKGTEDVRNAAKTFIGAFKGTGAQIAMFDFALNARVNVDVPYTEVTEGSMTAVFIPAANRYAPLSKNPDYLTNWDNALLQALYTSDSSSPRADAVVFVTDGDPTALNGNHGKPDEVTKPNPQSSSAAGTLNNAIAHSNELKAEKTHMYALGVGSGVTNTASQSRLKAISGPQEFKPGVPVGSADWLVVKNFGDLASTLADLATDLCESSVRVTKRVDEDGDGAFDDPAGGWSFKGDLDMSSGSYGWRQPTGSADPGRRTVTVTDGNPTAMFEWDPSNANASATFTFAETPRLGYRFVDADCGNRTVTRADVAFSVTLPAGQSASCTVRNARLKAVTFCHATGDPDEPYDLRTEFLNDAGHASLATHLGHDGALFPAGDWGDVIPPYDDSPSGLNWTPAGQVVWQNDCVVPRDVQNLRPLLQCVEDLGNGRLRGHFGYRNPADHVLHLTPGSEWNRFSPEPADRAQLERFATETTVADAVQAEFGPDEELSWTLGTHSITASAKTTRCQGTITVVKQLDPVGDGRFNLRIDGEIAGTGRLVGDNGTTGTIEVDAVPGGTVHTVDETGGPRTRLDRYDTSTICRNNADAVVGEASSGSVQVTVRLGEDVLCTITNTRQQERIVPVLECVRFDAAGPDTAVWGYDNGNDYPVDLPVGDGGHNVFLPAPADRGQMVTFGPGRQRDVLEVAFESDNGGTLTWNIDESRTANANSQPCATVVPNPPEPPSPVPTPPSPPTPATDIAVTKIATPAVIAVGSKATWAITVVNLSSVEAPNVTAYKVQHEFADAGRVLSVAPSQGVCDATACHLDMLAPGASATISVVSEQVQTRMGVNTVRVSTSAPETDLTNNTSSAVVRVIGAENPTAAQRCAVVTVVPGTVTAGRTAVVSVRALDAVGRRIGGLALQLRGRGVRAGATTNVTGTARLAFTARVRGVISVAPPGRTARPGVPQQCAVVLGVHAAQAPSGVTG